MRVLNSARKLKVSPLFNKYITCFGDFIAREGKFINYAGINAALSCIAQGHFNGYLDEPWSI